MNKTRNEHLTPYAQKLQREMDAACDRYLKSLGIRVLRYTNADVRQRFQEVCQDIWNYVMEVTE